MPPKAEKVSAILTAEQRGNDQRSDQSWTKTLPIKPTIPEMAKQAAAIQDADDLEYAVCIEELTVG